MIYDGSRMGVWSSRWVFFLAATAGAVGLGNIWKFPFVMAENGGSAFVGLYLLCIALMGVPMMLSEVVIGHIGQANPVQALKNTASRSQASQRWSLIGFLGLFAGLSIFVLLSVVASWAISYLLEMYQGSFADIGRTAAIVHFATIRADLDSLFLYQSGFVATVVAILIFGFNKGLARSLVYLVPMSAIVLLFLLYYSVQSQFFEQSIHYLFRFDASKIGLSSFLLAFEHAFYTLSIGMGSLMVFGAYLPKKRGIGAIVCSVALVDIVVSALVGLIIFPSLLLAQVSPASGYDLLFVSLPTAYGDMVNGQIQGVLFFVFVLLTALSSALVLLEPSIVWLSQSFKTGRWAAAVIIGFIAWLISLASFDQWTFIHQVSGLNYKLFDLLNIVTAKMVLPLAGLLVAIYVGWILKPALVRDEIKNSGIGWLYLWYFLIRFIVPSLFLLVLVLNQLDEALLTALNDQLFGSASR
ncbi:MAG: sodium-dependent transporter [Oceanospirillaceae bacterium]|nr:sodium-dependent transporter [Oceanospirillaceae bacterium]